MPLYEFLRLAIEKLESSHHKPSCLHPPSETENDLFGQKQQLDVVATSPTRLSLLPDTPSICDEATLGHSTIARTTEKCSGGVEYIFNDISPELDLSQKDETFFPWLSYPGDDDDDDDDSMQDYSSANKMLMSQKNGRSSCDQTVGNLDNSLQGAVELSSFKARLHQQSAPSLDVDSHAPTAIHSTQLLAQEPKELFVDGRTKNMMLDTFVKTKNREFSSVSYGNSAGRIRIPPYTKRMPCDNEESECQSDEPQNESVGLKKASVVEGGSRSKRRRVAQVHNLSERRRRDRINQKMHALQELIPNCNKTDKASMLDEAVEYIKNLKHQVQIMSMGSGFVPALMSRPMYHAPVPHLSYMGTRMGMSTCFGDTNMGMGLGSPVIQGPLFFPITGLGLGYHQANSMMGSGACFRVPAHNQAPSTSLKSNTEDLVMNKIRKSSLINCTSSQMQARNEVPIPNQKQKL